MGRGKKWQDTKETRFKRLYGVKPDTFHKMVSILQKEFDALHKNGGKPPKLKPEDKLYITLTYLRQYHTMDRIAAEYGVCKGTVCLSIQWVEDTLAGEGTFALPGKKKLKRKSTSIQYVVVDVTESPINRPQKNQKEYYSGKKTAYLEDAGHH
jgi:transposase-like protein